jgi:hypothetical protein
MNDIGKRVGIVLCFALIAGCTTTGESKKEAAVAAGKVEDKTRSAMGEAARTPFSDLNLVRKEIPEVLKTAHQEPYAIPRDPSCEGIAKEVEALDAVLGADLDTPATGNNPSLIERGADALGDSAGGAIRGAVEGLIPYRSWIRRLSGAERYSREVVAAIAAGTVRRAYLKGIGQAQGCREPAAPKPAA